MSVPDSLRCLFTATVERRNGSYVVSVPESEVDAGTVSADQTYRVGVFDPPSGGSTTETKSRESEGRESPDSRSRDPTGPTDRSARSPPVEEGEIREVEIESIGDQGDGIAKVERGFVIIVPGTNVGDVVEVEIERVMENVAFARTVEESDEDDDTAF